MRRILTLAVLLAACRDASDTVPVDGDGFPYPPPRTDAFPAVGSADTLEVAAWNIENFPDTAMTPARVADLIASLDLDIVICEEIASESAWQELLARLRDRDGILSEHRYTPTEYQKIGIIYKRGLVVPDRASLLFTSSAYEFPRPPLTAYIAVDDGVHRALSFRVIGVHLKAGGTDEDGARRKAAIEILDQHVHGAIDAGDEDEIVIAGDYNEILTTAQGQTNFGPLLTDPLYTVQTRAAATAGEISFVPSGVMLDHVTTTAGFAPDLPGAQLVIPRLHAIPGYTAEISDHLPVVLVVPLQAK